MEGSCETTRSWARQPRRRGTVRRGSARKGHGGGSPALSRRWRGSQPGRAQAALDGIAAVVAAFALAATRRSRSEAVQICFHSRRLRFEGKVGKHDASKKSR
ncbi:pollen-specific leucine-rich repeat extensin-like protein 4 [Iris pallida]|uniref:Pollen-specific leucine-rich repeat extensin-like protein 4 n=1 Tax=Iris pallida TaxID=29817 RepID=A0AAX6DNH2_IRIPA|nr:pollen-specific leucine-rich repeat extensin-like protein 4 [Iris pallida]